MIFDPAALLGLIYGASEVGLSIRRRAGTDATQVVDEGSLRLLWITIMLSVFLAYSLSYALPDAGFGAATTPVEIVGIVVYALGMCLRWYSIIYLGRFFTVNVAIAADHRLIDGGPYRHVRHPSYAGALMGFLGLGLTLANWASLAIVVVPIFLAFARRMHVEESALLQGLGAQYRHYMNRTKRLIPGVY